MIIVDAWTQPAQDLVRTMRHLGRKDVVLSLEPDGFLPTSVESPFLYYLGDREREGKPLFFDQVPVPDFWEIQGDASHGWIRQRNKTRANIVYVTDTPYRLVKAVEWCDDAGRVRSVDHYNRYGEAFAKTTHSADGHAFQTIYYDDEGQERIVENHRTQDILLITDEGTRLFHDRMAFYVNFLRERHFDLSHITFNTLATSFFVSLALSEPGHDTLVWQEGIQDALPGNMQFILDNPGIRCNKILVPIPETYDRIQQLVPSQHKKTFDPFGYAYNWTKDNKHQKQALIVTNSDQIEHLQALVEGLPGLTFHIAAPTEMSPTLMSYIRYHNVVLHQNASQAQLDALTQQCDIYLDINHYQEVPQATRNAFLANHLIMGYTTTAHNRQYIAPEHLFDPEDTPTLIQRLKTCMQYTELWEEALTKQRKSAGALTR